MPVMIADAGNAFITGFIVLNVILGLVTSRTALERKFAARMQSRIAPTGWARTACSSPSRTRSSS